MPGLLSLLLSNSQNTLLTLRGMTASLGVLSTLLLYLLVRTSLGTAARATALLAGLLHAVYPFAVFYNRIGFSYNLLTPLLLIAAGGFWFYLDRGRRVGLAVAALAIGLGAVTDLMMISLTAPFVLVALVRRGRDVLWGVPLLALPFGAYAVAMLLRDAPAFLFDVQFTLGRLTVVPWWAQLPLLTLNLGALALSDPWWIPAVIGLLLLRPPRWRLLMLALLCLPLLVLGRSSGLAGLRRYSISPLFPLVALGMSNLLALGLPWILRFAQVTLQEALARVRWLSGSPRSDWLRRRLVALGSAGTVFLLGRPRQPGPEGIPPGERLGLRSGPGWSRRGCACQSAVRADGPGFGLAGSGLDAGCPSGGFPTGPGLRRPALRGFPSRHSA